MVASRVGVEFDATNGAAVPFLGVGGAAGFAGPSVACMARGRDRTRARHFAAERMRTADAPNVHYVDSSAGVGLAQA